uniref:SH2 domain-containing protein n=1 Tax=Stegastes partitus TaxID=144197 RepID=A0A3B5BGP1_9TELE
ICSLFSLNFSYFCTSPRRQPLTCTAPRMERSPGSGGLKDLVLRWFTETQAPSILHHGSFPNWFQGLAARKDAEDLLRDKAVGCFLIRLSDKAVGYILSYRGHDRCRHFVITQNQDGQFVISGDSQTFSSLLELIEHYKVSPIQPFGEYLTCSCYQVRQLRCPLRLIRTKPTPVVQRDSEETRSRHRTPTTQPSQVISARPDSPVLSRLRWRPGVCLCPNWTTWRKKRRRRKSTLTGSAAPPSCRRGSPASPSRSMKL